MTKRAFSEGKVANIFKSFCLTFSIPVAPENANFSIVKLLCMPWTNLVFRTVLLGTNATLTGLKLHEIFCFVS